MKLWAARLSAVILAAAFSPALAMAHPHVLVDAEETLVFDGNGDLIGIAGAWSFDDAFSAYAVQGYDSTGDGKPTREDLQPLAQTNVQSLSEYHFFTQIKVDGKQLTFDNPKDVWDDFSGEKLILHFTLPLTHPLHLAGHELAIEVYDPDYFAAVTFPGSQATIFPGEPKQCVGTASRPSPLDSTTAARLAQIPVTQRELPSELRDIANRLVNVLTIQCRRD